MNFSIKLQTNSILHVPFFNYQQDFTFRINNQEFKTNKFIADLLSPKISKIHQIDPTLNEYSIKTRSSGNFQTFIDLLNFEEKEISNDDLSFISEIVENLCIEQIDIKTDIPKISIDNIINLISYHEKSLTFFKSQLKQEIDFLSSHLNELTTSQEEELIKLSDDILEQVFNNDNILIESETQLLRIINKLYAQNSQNAKYYEYIYFPCVETDELANFISIFDTNDITGQIWGNISERLLSSSKKETTNRSRYKQIHKQDEQNNKITIQNSNLRGIFYYIKENLNLYNIKITSTNLMSGNKKQLLDIENTTNDFCTENEPGSWICFEFKEYEINPSGYAIRTESLDDERCFPKSWVIEGSSQGTVWTVLDEQVNTSILNGKGFINTFQIPKQEQNRFKFIRMRLTGPNWKNNANHRLDICSIEFYGDLYK